MTTHITKTWFDGEKVVMKEIPESEVYKQEPVAWADMDVRGEDKGLSWTPGQFHTQPLYTAPQSINEFKPDWDTVKAYDEKFAEMLDEQQRLRAELKRTEQRLHDVATLCANVEGVLKAVNTAAMKLTADLTCMDVDNDDRLDRDHVMERVMRWRNEWDKAMFEYKPKAAPRQEHYDQTSLELCKECGWKAVIPGDGCLVCARQKAKPVAWMYDFLADDRDKVIRNWVTQSQDDIKRENGFNVRPLYTAPRQWVGLTDEEVNEFYWISALTVEAIEAKLKEKNT